MTIRPAVCLGHPCHLAGMSKNGKQHGKQPAAVQPISLISIEHSRKELVNETRYSTVSDTQPPCSSWKLRGDSPF